MLGWGLLPRAQGRLQFAIEIVDPRPLSAGRGPAAQPQPSGLPEGLKILGAVPVIAVAAPSGAARWSRVLLVPKLSELVTSADTELGQVGRNESGGRAGSPRAAAGAATSLTLGPATVDGVEVKVVALLQPLGPIFDRSLIIEEAPATREMLRHADSRASYRYLVPVDSWQKRGQVLARLSQEPGLLPAPNAEVLSEPQPAGISSAGRSGLAAALIAAGVLVIGLQLRGLTRAGVSRRFARS